MITIEEFKKIRSKSHLIVLDTNIFLELYRQPANISIDVIEALSKILNNLYMPRQVYDEYIRNYQTVCGSEKKKYQKVSRELTESVRKLQDDISSKTNEYRKHNYSDITKLQTDLNNKIDDIQSIIKTFESDHKIEISLNLDFLNNDKVKEFVDLLKDQKRIGTIIPFSEKLAILQEGKIRFDNLLPPGFKDCEKEGADKYGDLLVWKDIIKVAKEQNVNIIFVCNDIKEDWWEKDRENPIELRNELLVEFKETNAYLNIHFLTLDKFFSYIAEELQVSKSKSALQLTALDDARILLDEYYDDIYTKVGEVLIDVNVEKELDEEFIEIGDEDIYWEIENVSVDKVEKIITYYIDLNVSVIADLLYREPGDYPYPAGVVALYFNGKIEITKEEYANRSSKTKLNIYYIEIRHIEPEIWNILKSNNNGKSTRQLIKENDALELYRNTSNINCIKETLEESKINL